MCDVPSLAVFCSESIECFPGTASKFFLKLLVTIPVAPIITGIMVHFRFHIRCISIQKLLYYKLLLLLCKVQNVVMGNTITCTINCNLRKAATLDTLDICCVSGMLL